MDKFENDLKQLKEEIKPAKIPLISNFSIKNYTQYYKIIIIFLIITSALYIFSPVFIKTKDEKDKEKINYFKLAIFSLILTFPFLFYIYYLN